MAKQIEIDFTAVPAGFVRGMLPGTIAPTIGSHKGVPMYPDSALAHCIHEQNLATLATNARGQQ